MILKTFMVPHPPLIIPSIGRGEENKILATKESYEEIAKEIKEMNPETIIISSPHTLYYQDYFHICTGETIQGDLSNFGASNLNFNETIDQELVDEIEHLSKENNFPAGRTRETRLDHGSMIPLYFIRKHLPNTKIIIVGLSSLPLIENYKFGIIIKNAVNNLNRKVVFVASGDLSHKLQEYGPYGYIKEGPIYDKKIMDTMSKANFKELLEYDEDFLEKAAECGHRSFTIMAGTLDGLNVSTKYLSHEDITGVGYGICSFTPKEENKERCFLDKYLNNKVVQESKDDYVKLAVASLTNYIKNKKRINLPANLPSEMLNNEAGVFVSIHKFGKLRGCIGTFLPTTDSIANEIVENAIAASTNDPRFNPITEDEIPYLEVNVDVLSPPVLTSKEELDPKKYGIIVTQGYKRGLLLPDLDGVDTIDYQIEIAKQKAGITTGDVTLQRFEVIRHK